MVMPRSRSRSIESSSCGRWLRASTVPVTSRMRSASVDFPWSMWAMIEKLRMCWSGRDIPASRLVAAPEAAGDETTDLVRLVDVHRRDRRGIDGDAGGDAEAERDHLRDERPPECLIKAVPEPIADAGEHDRGGQHLRHREQAGAALDAVQEPTELVPLRRRHRQRPRDRPEDDPGDP